MLHDPRPRIQRAFFAWLEEARPRFKREVRIMRRTDKAVEFAFDVGGPALQGWLNRHEITVGAFHDGGCWDLIFDVDAYPERRGEGYVCSQCEREGKHETFASREALWLDHLFEPFLGWLNENLAPAKALVLRATEDGRATWAQLKPEEPSGFSLLGKAVKVVSLIPPSGHHAKRRPRNANCESQ